jgi:hypothetical protein
MTMGCAVALQAQNIMRDALRVRRLGLVAELPTSTALRAERQAPNTGSSGQITTSNANWTSLISN